MAIWMVKVSKIIDCLTGDEEVVHLAGTQNDGLNVSSKPSHVSSSCGKSFNKAKVKRESVWDVMLDSKVEINNSKDRRYTYAQSTY